MGLLNKIKQSLIKTKEKIGQYFYEIFKGKELDEDFYESLEFAMLVADMGSVATNQFIQELKEQAYKKKITTPEEAKIILKEIMCQSIDYIIPDYTYPLVLLVVGVNGVGKTTAIGKLAKLFVNQNKSVVIAAADTFRAAASEQLGVWAKRANVRLIEHTEGSDPAAVVYDALASARANKTDVVLVDTAGRLHNKKNLMEELKKINRVIERELPECDQRNMIVIDATTGQNAINQVEVFNEAIEIDGIILTKLDGTAKGGVVMAISAELEIPIVYCGVGEKIEDLISFNAEEFVDAII